jgi:4a-hydroxytetrahydrobiopterin dehydratase
MSNEELASRKCVPCKQGTRPLTETDYRPLLTQLGEGWDVVDEHHLAKTYKFKNFVQALDFVNRVGAIAEAEGHHPDIHLAWGKAHVETWTHSIGGLSESDFVLAAKIDRLPR